MKEHAHAHLRAFATTTRKTTTNKRLYHETVNTGLPVGRFNGLRNSTPKPAYAGISGSFRLKKTSLYTYLTKRHNPCAAYLQKW